MRHGVHSSSTLPTAMSVLRGATVSSRKAMLCASRRVSSAAIAVSSSLLSAAMRCSTCSADSSARSTSPASRPMRAVLRTAVVARPMLEAETALRPRKAPRMVAPMDSAACNFCCEAWLFSRSTRSTRALLLCLQRRELRRELQAQLLRLGIARLAHRQCQARAEIALRIRRRAKSASVHRRPRASAGGPGTTAWPVPCPTARSSRRVARAAGRSPKPALATGSRVAAVGSASASLHSTSLPSSDSDRGKAQRLPFVDAGGLVHVVQLRQCPARAAGR